MLWSERNNQYELSKQTIDIINIKCHDLKHQIHKLDGYSTINNANKQEIENALKIYDSTIKTGNNALDVILTEKSLLGNQKGISFNVIADGKILNFIDPTDIYALFGNAIDNALEALTNIDITNKTISIIIKKVNSF